MPSLVEQSAVPVQSSISGGTLYLTGKFSSTERNVNRRIYGADVWDALFEDAHYRNQLKRGALLGGLGHPKDGIFDPMMSAVVLREQYRRGSDVLGKLEVLNTPAGKIVQTLHESGIELGVSSRGQGKYKQMESGDVVILPGFQFEGYDIVTNPSVRSATPKYVMEEEMRQNENSNFASAVLSRIAESDLTATECKGWLNLMESCYTEEGSTTYRTLKLLLEDSHTRLQSKETSNPNPPSTMEGTISKTFTEEELNDKVALAEAKLRNEGAVNSLQEATKQLQESRSTVSTQQETIASQQTLIKDLQEQAVANDKRFTELNKRYTAAVEIIEEQITQHKTLQESHNELVTRHTAAKSLIDEYYPVVSRAKLTEEEKKSITLLPTTKDIKLQEGVNQSNPVPPAKNPLISALNRIQNFERK